MDADLADGQWLRDRSSPRWGAADSMAGVGFDRYVRLPHPVTAERLDLERVEHGMHPVLERRSWSWDEVARRNGKLLHSRAQWHCLVTNTATRPVDDGWRIGSSEVGWLNPALLALLVPHLAGHTTPRTPVVVGVWEGAGCWFGFNTVDGMSGKSVDTEAWALRPLNPLLALCDRDYLLFSSTLEVLADPLWCARAAEDWGLEQGLEPSSNLVWPANRSWVVATEIDWDSTIVAGPSALIESVLADPKIEALEVGPHDDLSATGDAINC